MQGYKMNVQEAVKKTLDIYKDEDEYQSIDNAMDYLLQIMKVDDEARIKKAVCNEAKKEMQIEIVKSVKDDFTERVGPSTVTHVFLSLDGALFELGRFYQGPYMSESADRRLGKILEFEDECKRLFSKEINTLKTSL